MVREIFLVCLLLRIWIAWGRKAVVVNVPATIPTQLTVCMAKDIVNSILQDEGLANL
jgi:hypothetical protein